MNNDNALMMEALIQSRKPKKVLAERCAMGSEENDEGLEQEPNIQLVDLGPTERGAVQYQVRVNDFTVGACIVFNDTVVFANQDMNRRIGTTVKFLPDNGMLDSLNGQQFRSIDAFKQAIKQSFQNWSAHEQ